MCTDDLIVREFVRRFPECIVDVVYGHVRGIGAYKVLTERVEVEFVLLCECVVEKKSNLWVVIVLAPDEFVITDGTLLYKRNIFACKFCGCGIRYGTGCVK